jgi:acyl-CoA dehydrogenase
MRSPGQKIYISWGDNDFTENTCHLVLARLPDAVPKGTKGISLFLVPKRLPDADGNAGVANSLKVVSPGTQAGPAWLPTCVMQYDGATGWLVGEPEHGGMAAMFTMMNNARLGVGVQGSARPRRPISTRWPTRWIASRGARRWRTGPGRSSTMPMCGGC